MIEEGRRIKVIEVFWDEGGREGSIFSCKGIRRGELEEGVQGWL
jgi:hypothetical protein